MRGKRFGIVEVVKQKSLEGLKNVPISEFESVLNNERIVFKAAFSSRG